MFSPPDATMAPGSIHSPSNVRFRPYAAGLRATKTTEKGKRRDEVYIFRVVVDQDVGDNGGKAYHGSCPANVQVFAGLHGIIAHHSRMMAMR